MLLVVKFHDLTGDVRLEAIVSVREIWESVGHDGDLERDKIAKSISFITQSHVTSVTSPSFSFHRALS